MELDAGLRAVTLERGDIAAVADLIRACQAHDGGTAERTREDMEAVSARPSFSLAESAVGVRDGEALVAFASIPWHRESDVFILPSHRGRGVGTALMRWTWDAASALGYASVGQSLHERAADGNALLEAHGYEHTRTAWILGIVLEAAPPPPALPDGYALRTFAAGRDDRAAFQVIEDAFAEWPDRDAESSEDWAAQTLGRPGFSPEQILLAVRGGEVVGAAALVEEEECVVEQLAVARDHRGRGLGRALLERAFAVAWKRGQRECALVTDSRTGALGLYEHVGMTVRSTYLHFERPLP